MLNLSCTSRWSAGVLEVWEFLCQFSEMLGLEEVPSISSLALDLGLSTNSNSSSPEVASSIILTILETLMREAFDSAVDIAAEASADVKPRDLSAAFPPIRVCTHCCRPHIHMLSAARIALVSGS